MDTDRTPDATLITLPPDGRPVLTPAGSAVILSMEDGQGRTTEAHMTAAQLEHAFADYLALRAAATAHPTDGDDPAVEIDTGCTLFPPGEWREALLNMPWDEAMHGETWLHCIANQSYGFSYLFPHEPDSETSPIRAEATCVSTVSGRPGRDETIPTGEVVGTARLILTFPDQDEHRAIARRLMGLDEDDEP